MEAVNRYEWLSRECDATILLSHEGFKKDTTVIRKIKLLDANGRKFDMKRTYRVVAKRGAVDY